MEEENNTSDQDHEWNALDIFSSSGGQSVGVTRTTTTTTAKGYRFVFLFHENETLKNDQILRDIFAFYRVG